MRVVKPKGVDDPAPLYQRAEAFLQENRLTPADRPPFQRFTGVSRIPETCVYSELQTEIFLPVD